MSGIRCARRAVLLALVTGSLFAVWIVSRPLALASRALGLRTHRALFMAWARASARVLNMDVRVEGTPPRPPFLLVTNHLGYIDVVTLAGIVPARFLSRADVAHWPIVGVLARAMGTLFIDRARKSELPDVAGAIAAVLARGEGVVLFPEGTSSDGSDVLPFRASLFEVAVRSGVPVTTATLSYRTPAGSPPAATAVCWWGDMTFGKHFLELLALPAITVQVEFGARGLHGSDRKLLALEAWKEVRGRLESRHELPVVSALP